LAGRAVGQAIVAKEDEISDGTYSSHQFGTEHGSSRFTRSAP